MPSPNYSSRGGSAVRLIVLHTAEGATTIQSLGSYFANPASGVSSHVGIDDTPETVGEYVKRGNKAWTAANANPVAVQAELCAFASWSPVQWSSHPVMLSNTAKWIAEEAATFGIPIVKLTPTQAQGNGRGVCQHSDLGSWGGGHWDCGPSFPIDQVISMASGSPAPPTVSPVSSSEDSTVAVITGPGRVDMFIVGTDNLVYQAMATDLASLASAQWAPIGDEHTYLKTVSASWTPDFKMLYLAGQGSDDHPYINVWDGSRWSGWTPNTNGTMNPNPFR